MGKRIMKLAFVFLFPIFLMAQKADFTASALVGLTDADMTYQAFQDGKILKDKGIRDQLFVARSPFSRTNDDLKAYPVSNSLYNNSKILAVSVDGKWMVVAETKGPLADSIAQIKSMQDLPNGQLLTLIDISDKTKPNVKFKIPVKHPQAVVFDPIGNYLLVASGEFDKELMLVEIDQNGKFVKTAQRPVGFPSGKIIDVAWHPSGQYFSFVAEQSREIGFVKVTRDASNRPIRLDLHGRLMRLGVNPSHTQFYKNGDFLLVLDKKNNERTLDINELYLVKFSKSDFPEHVPLSNYKVGRGVENFSIHPNQENVFLISKEGSSLAPTHADFTPSSKLIGLKIEASGAFTETLSQNIDGGIMNQILFDQTGQNAAVVVSEYLVGGKKTGGIEFFKVELNSNKWPSQPYKIFLNKGIHNVFATF